MKPTDSLNSILIGITNLLVSGSLSTHHQEFLAVHRHWYIFADLMTVATRSRMELQQQFHPAPGSNGAAVLKFRATV